MSMIRRAVVSGRFYPAQASELEEFIRTSVPAAVESAPAKAVILPHAGYLYSGKVAVETVASVLPKDKLLILGPNHTGRGAAFAVFSHGAWKTPLGEVAIDSLTAEKLINKGILEEDTAAHSAEHSIEVQLPIFQVLFNEFTFIPITCAAADLSVYSRIAGEIREALEEKADDFLFVASSDMTHYEPGTQAKKKDAYVLEAILNLDIKSFLSRVKEKDVSMCGVAPVGILLEVLKTLGAQTGQLIRYTTSGEINNDHTSVVGYAGVKF
ncbi:AmmeMemoRadiSam system protein B [Candidatus Omnitrophota bacterium]